jgi:hypothetical protein
MVIDGEHHLLGCFRHQCKNMSSTTENSIGKSKWGNTIRGVLANREIVLGRRLCEMAMTYLNM